MFNGYQNSSSTYFSSAQYSSPLATTASAHQTDQQATSSTTSAKIYDTPSSLDYFSGTTDGLSAGSLRQQQDVVERRGIDESVRARCIRQLATFYPYLEFGPTLENLSSPRERATSEDCQDMDLALQEVQPRSEQRHQPQPDDYTPEIHPRTYNPLPPLSEQYAYDASLPNFTPHPGYHPSSSTAVSRHTSISTLSTTSYDGEVHGEPSYEIIEPPYTTTASSGWQYHITDYDDARQSASPESHRDEFGRSLVQSQATMMHGFGTVQDGDSDPDRLEQHTFHAPASDAMAAPYVFLPYPNSRMRLNPAEQRIKACYSSRTRNAYQCDWDRCGEMRMGLDDMLEHLSLSHGIPTGRSSARIERCLWKGCEDVVFKKTDVVYRHVLAHVGYRVECAKCGDQPRDELPDLIRHLEKCYDRAGPLEGVAVVWKEERKRGKRKGKVGKKDSQTKGSNKKGKDKDNNAVR